jgi:hypothetical protein
MATKSDLMTICLFTQSRTFEELPRLASEVEPELEAAIEALRPDTAKNDRNLVLGKANQIPGSVAAHRGNQLG